MPRTFHEIFDVQKEGQQGLQCASQKIKIVVTTVADLTGLFFGKFES